MKNKTNISNTQIDLLKHEIYMVLIAGYDNEGNELGMGEMGECEDTAAQIIKDWCEKANIEVVNHTLNDLKEAINNASQWNLEFYDIISLNGWNDETGKQYGICNDGKERLQFDELGQAEIVSIN